MYIRRVKDEKRVFLVRTQSKQLAVGDGFTLVMDKYLYVLRRKVGTTPQFESVVQAHNAQSSNTHATTSSSTTTSTRHSSPDPFAYTTETTKSSKPSTNSTSSNGAQASKEPISIDLDEDEAFRTAIALSRQESGVTEKDATDALEEPKQSDEELARQLAEQWKLEDAEQAVREQKQEAAARLAAANPRPTHSLRHADPTAFTRSLLTPAKRSVATSSKPGDLIGASSRLNSTPSSTTAQLLSHRKVVEVDEDLSMDAGTALDMDDIYDSAPSKASSKAAKLASVRPKTGLGKPKGHLTAPIPGASKWATDLDRPPKVPLTPPRDAVWQSKAKTEVGPRPSNGLPVVVSKSSLQPERLSAALLKKTGLELEEPRPHDAKRAAPPFVEDDEDDDGILGNLDSYPSPSKKAKR